MFTIAHLSDLHLGYLSGRKKLDENGFNVRENDGYIAFNKAIDQIINEKIDIGGNELIIENILIAPTTTNIKYKYD